MSYTLPTPSKRLYLSHKFNPLNKKDLKEVIFKLTNILPCDFKSAAEWFGTFHELSCSVSEAQTILELNMSLNNQDKSNEKKLEEFEQNILSELLSCREKMMDIYLNSPFKYAMHAFDNGRIEKELLIRKKFSIPALSHLQIEENKIIREYKKWTHSAATPFLGNDKLLSAVVGKLHDANPGTRKDAFFTYWGFVKKNEEVYQALFDRLLYNRREQAHVAGCKNYTEIAFAELGRFDYGEKECAELRNTILSQVVPVITKICSKQLSSLKESSLKPWNAQTWPDLTPQNLPANGSMPELISSLQKITTKIAPSFGKLFTIMQKRNLIDVLPKTGKSPGAFSVTFQESELPFLFGNFGANHRDIFTFIHEFGHCLHGSAVTNIKNILLRQPGFEFCELASIGLELLASSFFSDLWLNSKDSHAALKYQLFQMLQFWPFMAMIDEWQHSVYSAEKFLVSTERNELWQQLSKKYKPHLNWDGCKEFEELGWLSRPHVFTSPFYFIDYGIAQIGALQLWQLSKENYGLAVEKYIKGLSLGSQVPLQELYQQMGLRFDFSEDIMSKLCELILNTILDRDSPP